MAGTPSLLEALKEARDTIANTLQDRGYKIGSCTGFWTEAVQREVATLSRIDAAIAEHEKVPVRANDNAPAQDWQQFDGGDA